MTIEARVYPAADPGAYAQVLLHHADQVDVLLSSLAAYGVEHEGHLYRDDKLSGAWVLDESGLHFGIAVDTTTDLR